jgi:acyl-CoA synthetase (AMP-forming)/AMP-acid ligase II
MGQCFLRFYLVQLRAAIDETNPRSLTETSPTILITPIESALRKIGSAGALLPSWEARIVDDDGHDVEPGKRVPGELWMRGCRPYSPSHLRSTHVNYTRA